VSAAQNEGLQVPQGHRTKGWHIAGIIYNNRLMAAGEGRQTFGHALLRLLCETSAELRDHTLKRNENGDAENILPRKEDCQ
jgi:hypothetical protein